MRKSKTPVLKGSTMQELLNKATIGTVLTTIDIAYAMRHDKYKVAALTGDFIIDSINPKYGYAAGYILLSDKNGTPYSLIQQYNTTTGFIIK